MRIKLTDVINKYPTNIDTESLIETFKNMILFSDEKEDIPIATKGVKITIDDIKPPKITEYEIDEKHLEEYQYQFKDYLLKLNWSPSEKTMSILFDIPLDCTVSPRCTYLFLDDGTEIHC